MSNTPVQDPPAHKMSSSSGQILPSRPAQPNSEPPASKRVCFYKSGDYQFIGHRMIVTARTFKTFDALLDALSKKVPLPFGVRTITTPRGTHFVKALEDLQDGGAYVCSDQKRVKPLNLDEVNRRQLPWNATRPLNAGGRKRPKASVRTPRKLLVIKNRDPTVRQSVVLQRKTAPTFDALLDYLSQILQFPVLKLYTTDGRRVDGLAALILCSGIIVAAGNEPFRLGNQRFNRAGLNGYLHRPSGPSETEAHQHHAAMETCGPEGGNIEHSNYTVPHDDDIEKSFRINQDGSMTVEMKVRLTIKEEEMLHWTTTLSRSGLAKNTVCASLSGSDNSSPDSNDAFAKDSTGIQEHERKVENYHDRGTKGVAFNDERSYKSYSSTTLDREITRFKRTPTPGPQHVNERASIESMKMVTETEVKQNTLGHYSYMERTADGETTEGYCVVRHSSSNKPVPRARRTPLSGVSKRSSSAGSSGVAEVLHIKNDGMEVTETVMHIYESQGCYDNYVANEEFSADGTSPVAESKPSTTSGPNLSSNDCDIDCNWHPPTTDSVQREKEEILSLSSGPGSLTHQSTNNLSSVTKKEVVCSKMLEAVNKDNSVKSTQKKRIAKPLWNEKGSASTNSSDRKHQESTKGSSKQSKYSSTDKLSSNTSVGKKSLNSLEGSKSLLNNKSVKTSESKKSIKTEKMSKNASISSLNPGNTKINPQKKKSQSKIAAKDNGHNINTPTGRPQMKKNMSDILQTTKTLSPSKKTVSRPKSMTEFAPSPAKSSLEQSENASLPSLNPSPSEIHQYVENWLEKVSQDPVLYTEDMLTDEAETREKVVFKIGGDSESDEINQCQTISNDAMKKSSSCLSVPLCHGGLATCEQISRGLCVSMPSVRADPENHENKLRLHKSVDAIGPNEGEPSSSNLLSPKAKLKPVLRQVCSSIQCIRRASASSTDPTLKNSSSLPNFSTQVASVFGSSCKAFVSFLSVMTLRDNLESSQLGEGNQSRTPSEAMLMMESLQKISALEDEEEQRESLTNLQSRASSKLRESWKDFQTLRERLESEPLSPRVSETEFALDVVSEGGDAFDDQQMVLNELMEELNMPQDLREEIVSTIQQTKSFYPAEESTFVETVRNQSESEEDVERFVEECEEKTKDSAGSRSTTSDSTEQQNPDRVNRDEMSKNSGDSKRYEALTNKRQDEEKISHFGKKTDLDVKENEYLKSESDTKKEVKTEMLEDSEEGKASVGKSANKIEEDKTWNGEVTEQRSEEETNFENEETGNEDSVEDTDEREGECETEEEGNCQDRETEETMKNEEEINEVVVEEEENGEEQEGEQGEDYEESEEEENCQDREPEETMKSEEEVNEVVVEEEENEEEQGEEEEEDHEEEEEQDREEEDQEEEQEEEEKEEGESATEKFEGSLSEETEKEVEEETGEKGGNSEIFEQENNEYDKTSGGAIFELNKFNAKRSEYISDNAEEKDEDEEVQLTASDSEGSREEEMENKEDEKSEYEEEKESENESDGKKNDEFEDEENGVMNTKIKLLDEIGEHEDDNEQNMPSVQTVEEEEEEERKSDEESKANQTLEPMEVAQKDQVEKGAVSENLDNIPPYHDFKTMSNEAICQQQHSNSCEETEESLSKYSSEGQYNDKCTDTIHETDEGGEEDRRNSLTHPVEISQELLDFVNDALQSYSLIFTYDTQGNIRIAPDNARVVQTKQHLIPKPRKDSSYGLKCLPSPVTSDLSDYRPETSGSGGYKTQESIDIVSESGEEPLDEANGTEGKILEQRLLKLSAANCSLKSGNSPSSDEGTKASGEDLSYFSAASSIKAETETGTENTQQVPLTFDKDSADGVLIDRGRWLLKENHLIRKSPPVSLGMYSNLDSTSTDTGQENGSIDSPSYSKTKHRPLATISSSELEEMAKPLTPKCTYYNMPHGSDSDPFLDDLSVRSMKHDASSIKARGFRVSPTVDTSKTWANRNGSLSSFASVEFKIPDRKVHPEVVSSAVTEPRRTSNGEQGALQAQDSLDSLHLRCGQYCPIL
uniref:RP1 axonemal microtubule associated n=1 Tax=Cyprinodon variegatus TaxID=28743 RepID=A0A3Q2CN61_CYPVA